MLHKMIARPGPGAALLVFALIAACTPAAEDRAAGEPAPAVTQAAAPAIPSYDQWIGTWTGPEGLFVTISDEGKGRYTLTMQSDLDTKATYAGTATAQGIAFERGGKLKLLKKATGEDTGLKWLADKRDCLMVDPGEGFCRD
jgi:hypothetical protein